MTAEIIPFPRGNVRRERSELQQRWWQVAFELGELILRRVGKLYDLGPGDDLWGEVLDHIYGLHDHGHEATPEDQPFVERLLALNQIEALGGWLMPPAKPI